VVSSLLLGLFTVWIFEYLTRKQERQSPITLSGIHMYTPAAEMIHYQQTAAAPLEQQQIIPLQALCVGSFQVLQLRVLLNASTLKSKQLISLLLSGLTIEDAASLRTEQIDLKTATITVTGRVPRTLIINRSLKSLFEQSGGYPVWTQID